jgi:hypothetical protein
MNIEPVITLRTTGVVLLLSIFLPLIGYLLISGGHLSGFRSSIFGIEGVGDSAEVVRKTFPVNVLTLVLTLLGYGMLTIMLHESGDKALALLAFILLLSSQIVLIFERTFDSSVTVWAAKELAHTSKVPELFQPLWQWMHTTVQMTFVYLGLLAIAAYGWAILQSALLSSWLGWSLIGWGGVWLIIFLVAGDSLPAVLFVPPLVIGIMALLA